MFSSNEIRAVLASYLRGWDKESGVKPTVIITSVSEKPNPGYDEHELTNNALIQSLQRHTATGKTNPIILLHEVRKSGGSHWATIFLTHVSGRWNCLFLDAATDNEHLITQVGIKHGLKGRHIGHNYVLYGGIQMDGHSCSLFALDHAIQLIQLHYLEKRDIFQEITHNLEAQQVEARPWEGFTDIRAPQLPARLVRLIQSQTVLDEYKKENAKGTAEIIITERRPRNCCCGMWKRPDLVVETTLTDIKLQKLHAGRRAFTVNPLIRRFEHRYGTIAEDYLATNPDLASSGVAYVSSATSRYHRSRFNPYSLSSMSFHSPAHWTRGGGATLGALGAAAEAPASMIPSPLVTTTPVVAGAAAPASKPKFVVTTEERKTISVTSVELAAAATPTP